MYTIKNNKNKFATLFTVILVLLLIRFFSAVIIMISEFHTFYIILVCVYGVLALLCALGLRRCSRSKLVINSSDLVYTPPFGASQTLSYRDLGKICMGGRAYVLYTKDDKKLIAFDDFRTENASSIVAFLKEKGVKADIY